MQEAATVLSHLLSADSELKVVAYHEHVHSKGAEVAHSHSLILASEISNGYSPVKEISDSNISYVDALVKHSKVMELQASLIAENISLKQQLKEVSRKFSKIPMATVPISYEKKRFRGSKH